MEFSLVQSAAPSQVTSAAQGQQVLDGAAQKQRKRLCGEAAGKPFDGVVFICAFVGVCAEGCLFAKTFLTSLVLTPDFLYC